MLAQMLRLAAMNNMNSQSSEIQVAGTSRVHISSVRAGTQSVRMLLGRVTVVIANMHSVTVHTRLVAGAAIH
jgi:hypothetical protein